MSLHYIDIHINELIIIKENLPKYRFFFYRNNHCCVIHNVYEKNRLVDGF